jgi:hypothetical protein
MWRKHHWSRQVAAFLLAALFGACSVVAASATPDTSGLVHTWHGENGNAYYFDGKRSVPVTDIDGLDLANSSSWTLEAWVFPLSSQTQHIAGKRGPCGAGDGFYQLAIGRGDPNKGMSIDPKFVPANTWTEVAISMAGDTGWKVYANGVMVKEVEAPHWKIENSAPFRIGAAGTCAPFIGVIDEVSLFRRALSAGELQSRVAAARAQRTPLALSECENDDCSADKIGGNVATWTFEGSRGIAVWPRARTLSTLEVERFDGQSVVFRRTNTANSAAAGLTAIYTGRITGDAIDGTVTWTWSGFKQGAAHGAWHARVGSIAVQQQQTQQQRALLASVPPAGGRPAMGTQAAVPTALAALMLLGATPDIGAPTGDPIAREHQIEARLYDAQQNCHDRQPHVINGGPSCDRIPELERELEDARADERAGDQKH